MAFNYSGQKGNAVPIDGPASTEALRLGYGLVPRMPVTTLSTAATAATLLTSQAGLILAGGWSSGATITLPNPPSVGLQFLIYFTAAPTSSPTVIRTGSSNVDMIGGGGAVASTNTAVQLASTASELGAAAWFIGLSTSRWAFLPLGGELSSAFTSLAGAADVRLWAAVDSTG